MDERLDLPPPAPRFYVGLDLGQVTDPTAILVIEQRLLPPLTDPRPLSFVERMGLGPTRKAQTPTPEATYAIIHVERLLGVSYVDQVAHVATLLDQLRRRLVARVDPVTRREIPPDDVALVLDRTGVGRAVSDLFAARSLPGVQVVPTTITAGFEAGPADGGMRCPKRDLVGAVATVLQRWRLKVHPDLPLAATLTEELKNFRITYTATGHARYEAGGDALSWREQPHDDLVLATSLAVWWGERNLGGGRMIAAFEEAACRW